MGKPAGRRVVCYVLGGGREKAVRDSEERHRRVLENLDEIVYMVRAAEDDPFRGVVEFVSGRVEDILGYKPQEFLDDPSLWLRSVHPADVHALEEPTRQVFATGKPAVREYRLRHKLSGEYRCMEDRITPQLDDADRVIGLLGAARDVTERKRIEGTLRASEERLRTLFKGIPIPTYAWRKVGEQVVLVDYNEAALAITRGRIAGVVGTTAHALYGDSPEILDDLARCLAQQATIKREMLYRFRTTGEKRHLAVTYGFVPPDGVIVHTEDITERKEAEAERARLLERVVSAQDEERRRIARELHDQASQSLTSVLVGLRAIQEARMLKDARTAAEELRPVAAQVLDDLGRLARGLHPSVLDDLGLVPALTRQARDHAQFHGIAVRVESERLGPDRLPAAVEMALYRIVQEALTNVTRHAAARNVTLLLAREGSAVELTVTDDGSGFDVDGTLQAKAASGHLGLLGMRERAAQLGGFLTIASRPGEGTRVAVRIPLGEA